MYILGIQNTHVLAEMMTLMLLGSYCMINYMLQSLPDLGPIHHGCRRFLFYQGHHVTT